MEKPEQTELDPELHDIYAQFIENNMTLITQSTIESKPKLLGKNNIVTLTPGKITLITEHQFQGVKCDVCGAILSSAEDVINHVLRDHVRDIKKSMQANNKTP